MTSYFNDGTLSNDFASQSAVMLVSPGLKSRSMI